MPSITNSVRSVVSRIVEFQQNKSSALESPAVTELVSLVSSKQISRVIQADQSSSRLMSQLSLHSFDKK
ncbi:hypothetical protein Peur_031273 [Populus x canadensis]